MLSNTKCVVLVCMLLETGKILFLRLCDAGGEVKREIETERDRDTQVTVNNFDVSHFIYINVFIHMHTKPRL